MAGATTRQAGPLAPLAGYRVGVAAHRGSQEQADALRAAGAEPVLGAVVGPVPLALDEGLDAVTEDLLALPPSVVVLTSAAGVEGWLSTAEGRGRDAGLREVLAAATVLAQGAEASASASALGLALAGTLPEEAAGARAQLDRRTGGLTRARVAVQVEAGLLGRRSAVDLVAGLVVAGIDVVEIPVPPVAPAEDPLAARRLVDSVVDRRLDALAFTGPDEVRAFARMADGMGVREGVETALNDTVVAVCLHRSCAGAAASVGIRNVVRPERPRVGAMIDALGDRLRADVIRLELGGVGVVLQGALILVDGEQAWLTDRERGLLLALARRPGTVVAKAELLRQVWRSDGTAGTDGHAVEVTVARLRRRLGAAGLGLQTVPRRGYRLVPG